MEHKSRSLLSVVGIAIGTSLTVAVLGLFGSLDASVESFTTDIAGRADLEVAAVSDEGFDESLFFEVAKVEGVKLAVPSVRSRVLIRKRQALLVGLDQRAEALGAGVSGAIGMDAERRALEGLFIGSGLSQDLGLEPGDRVRVSSSGGETTATVAAVVDGPAADFNQGMFAATTIPLAQKLSSRPAKLDSIFVVAQAGTDKGVLARRLARTAGPVAAVDSPSERVRQARTTTRTLRYGMLMGVSMALVVGGFGIFNTMNVTALERRRELATLRAIGGRKSRLLRLFLSEALVVAAAGSVLGAAAGVYVSKRLVEAIPSFFSSAVGVELGFHLPALAVPLAVTAGMAVALAASYIPAQRAVRVPPAESMKPEGSIGPSASERIRPVHTAAGLFAMVAGFSAALVGPGPAGYLGLGGLMGGAILASFGMMQPLTRVTAAVAGTMGVSGRLAAVAIERSPRRAWASSAAVVTAVGMVIAQTAITSNLGSSLTKSLKSLEKIDLYVSADDGTSFGADVLLPESWRPSFEAIDGVAHAGTSTFSFVSFRGNKILVQGVSGSVGAEPAMAGVSPEVRAEVERGAGAIVSDRFSDLYGLKAGDVLSLDTPTGHHSVRVSATVPSFTWERGLVTIGAQRMQEWFGRTGVSDYLLVFEDSADRARVESEVRSVVGESSIPVYLNSGSEYLDLLLNTVGQVNRLFDSLALVVVVAAMLAVLNALLISVVERKRELGIMRAIGAGRRQLSGMVAAEAVALGVVGGITGCLLGALAHRGAVSAISRQGGIVIEYSFLLYPALVILAAGIASTVIGSLEPARRAGRINVVEAIGYE